MDYYYRQPLRLKSFLQGELHGDYSLTIEKTFCRDGLHGDYSLTMEKTLQAKELSTGWTAWRLLTDRDGQT
jgi:hypothetical protein